MRYADDCNVYVRSRRAGERVMGLLQRLYTWLKLRINDAKSAIAIATCYAKRVRGRLRNHRPKPIESTSAKATASGTV